MSPAALAFSGGRPVREIYAKRGAPMWRGCPNASQREERGRNRGADATWRTSEERRTRMKKIGQENLGENLGPLAK